MKNSKYALVIIPLLVAAWVLPVLAASMDLQPLGVPGQAANCATHVVAIDYENFSTTVTNVPETNTVSISAGTYVEMVKMDLVRAFDTANTNYTGSFAVTVGDADDADKYLTSTELASDGTEVWCKRGRPLMFETDNSTATNTILTNSATYYATATNLTFTFTPNAEEATSANSSGEALFYFRVW